MSRSRLSSLIAIGLSIAAGLASRRLGASLPDFVARYAGDTLWAMTVFLTIGLFAPAWPTLRVAVTSLAAAFAVEASQLYHAPWIDAVRNTRPFGLLLGYGFLWSDLLCYTAGVGMGALGEWIAGKTD